MKQSPIFHPSINSTPIFIKKMGYIAKLEEVRILMSSFSRSLCRRNYRGRRLNFKNRLTVVSIIVIPSISMSKVLLIIAY